jgi:hypothetical protein
MWKACSFIKLDDLVRMVAPALGRRRVQRGLRWIKNPGGNTKYSEVFLVAHGFMQDEIAPASVLKFLWKEATAPSPTNFARRYA